MFLNLTVINDFLNIIFYLILSFKIVIQNNSKFNLKFFNIIFNEY